mgnify:FL=1
MENRVIKFRVWDKMLKKFHTPTFAKSITNPPSHFLPSQFTGMVDAEGKEIYEGDILEINHYHINIRWWKDLKDKVDIEAKAQIQRDHYNTWRVPVVFKDGQFGIDGGFYHTIDSYIICLKGHFRTGKTYFSNTEEKSWGYVVVGNIYENPELVSNGRD